MRGRTMKLIVASLAITLFLVIGKFFVLPVFAATAINVPHYLTFEGQLTNAAGTYQTNTFSMVFTIYDALTGGTALWTETQPTVSVASGYFTVQLGSVTALNLDFSKQYWVTVNVASDGEMTPRIPLNSVGYAYASDVAYSSYVTSTAPTAVAGKLYYDSTDGNLYVYDGVGAAWRDMTAGVGGAGLTSNNAFTGLNTFSATTTMATSTMTGLQVTTTSTLQGTLNIAAVLQGGTALVFEGATANDFETSFVITDPTADRTITFPNDDGTVVLASALPTYGQILIGNSSSGYTFLTTSTLGLLTTNVSEGTGLYWTPDRFDTRLSTTTTLPNLTTLTGLVSVTTTLIQANGLANFTAGLLAGSTSSTISGLAVTSTASTIDLVSQGRYLRIGDAGFTSQSLSANDDLLVSGKLEVDSSTYFDTQTFTAVTSTLSKLAAATSGVTTYNSAALVLEGSAWATSGSASSTYFKQIAVPTSAATPTGKLSWQYALDSAVYGEKMSLTSAGTLTVVQDFSARSGVVQMGEFVASTAAGSGGWFWYNSATNSKPDGFYNYFIANSGTNVAHVLDNTNALSGSTKIFSVRTANKEVAYVGGDNSFGIGNGTATTTIYGSSTSTFPYGATFASTGGQVGIGAGATYPSSTLHVVSSGLDQLRLGNDTNTKYLSLNHNGIEGVLDTGNNSGLRLSMYDTATSGSTVASSTYMRFEASAWNTTGGGSVSTVSTTIQLVPRTGNSVTSYLNFIDSGTQYLVMGKANNITTPYLAGQAADGASGIGISLGGWNLSTASDPTSRLVSFKKAMATNGGTEVASVNATGTIWASGGITVGAEGNGTLIDDASNGSASTILYIGSKIITTEVSDVRLKENISDSTINALSVLKGLHIVDFDWKYGPSWDSDHRVTGMIAQELYDFLPQVVVKPDNPENMWAIDYPQMVPYVIKAVLEQQAEIQALSLNLQGNSVGNVNQDTLAVVDMSFQGKLKVKGQVAFGQDTVGQVKILVGATEAQVNFNVPYEYQPIVTLTPASDNYLTKYYVASASSTGFIIKIEPQQTEKDVLFNWHAFGSEMPLSVIETPATIVEPPAVLMETPAPVIEIPPTLETPVEPAPTPALETPTPMAEPIVPVIESPAPPAETPAPAVEAPPLT